MTTSEIIVGTADGVVKARSYLRVPKELRWSSEAVDEIKSLPWKPYVFSEDDRIHTGIPVRPSYDGHEGLEPKEKELDIHQAPKRCKLFQKH